MNRLLLLLFVVALPLAAEVDPPVAWSGERITLAVSFEWTFTCGPTNVSTSLSGQIILITVTPPTSPTCIPTQPVISRYTLYPSVGPLAPGVYEVRLSTGGSERLVRMLYVRDAEAPFTVEPQVLIHSMREFELRFPTPRTSCQPTTSCVIEVTVGGRTARIVRSGSHEIVAEVPNSIGFGTHDVVLKEGNVSHVARAALTIARADNIPPSLTERILIPVFWAGAGAHGSLWTTDVWFRNENYYGVLSTDQTIGICTSLISPCPYFPLNWNDTLRLDASREQRYPSGLQLFVPRGSAERLRATALVRDLTRQSEAIGTELPIVREDDFNASEFSLVRVPVGDQYRTALRIYGTRGGTIRLLIYDLEEGVSEHAVVSQTMNLQGSNDPRVPPSIIIPDLAAQFPRLREVESGMVRIHVVPQGDEVWAFASVTNNTTQHVTNIRPQ